MAEVTLKNGGSVCGTFVSSEPGASVARSSCSLGARAMKALTSLRLWLTFCVALLLGCGAGNGEIRVTNDPFTGPQRGFALYLDMGHFTAVGVAEAQGKFALEVLVFQRGLADQGQERREGRVQGGRRDPDP
jgi:hypothetical protein